MAEKFITVTELALKSRLSQPFVSNCVNGFGNPKPATIGRIAHALGVNVTDIIEKAGGTDKSK